MDKSAPVLLNVLRVCDVPEVLGMIAPRPVTLVGDQFPWADRTAALYERAGATGKFVKSNSQP